MHSCALVSRDGSIDWCCFPRFDSPAIFCRILDWARGGYFKIAPRGVTSVSRRYLPGTKILETTLVTGGGVATLVDFMPAHLHVKPEVPMEIGDDHRVMRILECTVGSVEFTVECFPRLDYGSIVPHADLLDPNNGFAHGGSDAISVYCSAPLREDGNGFRSEGTLRQGQKLRASVTYEARITHHADPFNEALIDQSLARTKQIWEEWSARCTYQGEYREDVLRSALTLKALTYAPSGGLVAAATTSLPESIGGERNWDYRYTWIRDAAFAVYALSILGYVDEARAFKEWLEWSTVGRAQDLQVMYGLGGERRLTELTLPHLDGYKASRPVRIGNGAYDQTQLDIYGEVLDSAHLHRRQGGQVEPEYWEYLREVVDYVMDHWRDVDEGVWETRGGQQHFVFSKMWCWVALDRAIKAARALELPGDVDHWRKVRAEVKEDLLANGYDDDRGAFVQSYGSKNLDAASLMLPLVGFIKATDPRMVSTVRAIERELTSSNGLVYRYRGYDDGLAGDEGTFTICTYWLVDNLILLGDLDRAKALFEKLRGYANDLGLLSEEIDGATGELLGNFPQAFSHMGLINTAVQLQRATDKLAAAKESS